MGLTAVHNTRCVHNTTIAMKGSRREVTSYEGRARQLVLIALLKRMISDSTAAAATAISLFIGNMKQLRERNKAVMAYLYYDWVSRRDSGAICVGGYRRCRRGVNGALRHLFLRIL